MLIQKSAVGGNLGAVAPGIITGDDDHPTFGVGSGKRAQGKRIRRHMQTHTLHHHCGSTRQHLRTVCRRSAERFVVGLKGTNALFQNQLAEIAQDVEEPGDGGTGITGHQMDAAFNFKTTFDEQFIARKYFPAVAGEKPRIECHNLSVLQRGARRKCRCLLFCYSRHGLRPGGLLRRAAAGDAVFAPLVRDFWSSRDLMAGSTASIPPRGEFYNYRLVPDNFHTL